MKRNTEQQTPLRRLAAAAGLVAVWDDVFGQTHEVADDVLKYMLGMLDLPAGTESQLQDSLAKVEQDAQSPAGGLIIVDVDETPVLPHSGSMRYKIELENGRRYAGVAIEAGPGLVSIEPLREPGYHTLSIGEKRLTIAVSPRCCPSVDETSGGGKARSWGLVAQVYSLRAGLETEQDPDEREHAALALPGWTGGDFSLVGKLAERAAQHGAQALAISPVHAMFAAAPHRYSPYSPSSRLFLNIAYIDPAALLGPAALQTALRTVGCAQDLGASTRATRVDWSQAVPARLKVLRQMYQDFCEFGHRGLVSDFHAFRQEGGEALESHARFEALHALQMPKLGPEHGWKDWAAELHDPRGPAVAAFARKQDGEIGFHAFLQWLACRGLEGAQETAREAGMSIGLIADLAIGTDPRGSHAWSRQKEILSGVSVGAPPDVYQAAGQNWGLTAFSPRALRSTGYAAFIETLRAAFAHAGGVRVDHVLGLGRMWVIPEGEDPSRGVYLKYPLDDMLRLLALEAWRHKAIVIGENLGTVPEGFDQKLKEKGVMGMNVLWFQRRPEEDKDLVAPFCPPASWPNWSMATSGTHDLATIKGWWNGRDLEWRRQLDELDEKAMQSATEQRQRDKKALWQALRDAGCVSFGKEDPPEEAPRDAVLSFVASAPSPLMLVPLEDLLGLDEQPNLPGTPSLADGSGHPNWTQLLPLDVEEIFQHPEVIAGLDAVIQARKSA